MSSASGLCAKCRTWISAPGDSWCVGCTAAAEITSELQRPWNPAYRRIAHHTLISATRTLKGLRALSAGFRSKVQSEVAQRTGAENTRAPLQVSELEDDLREELPRRRSTSAKSAAKEPLRTPVSSEESESATENEADTVKLEEAPLKRKRREESPPPHPHHKPLGGDQDKKPPEPDHPPPQNKPVTRSTETRQDTVKHPWRNDQHRDRRERSQHHHKKKKPRHRAGRKHQRLHRLLIDPSLPVHQRPPSSYWELEDTLDALGTDQWRS